MEEYGVEVGMFALWEILISDGMFVIAKRGRARVKNGGRAAKRFKGQISVTVCGYT